MTLTFTLTPKRGASNSSWRQSSVFRMLPLCSSQNGSLTLCISALSNFPQPSTFYIVLWLLKTLALESDPGLLTFLLPNCLHPQALSFTISLTTLHAQQSWNHTQTIYGECSCFCILCVLFLEYHSCQNPSPFSKPQVQSLQPCPLALCSLPSILLKGCLIGASKNRTNKIYLERDWF